MQCACATLPSVACRTLLHFSILSHNRRDFRKHVIGHKMYFSSLSTSFAGKSFYSKKNWARYDKNVRVSWSSCEVLVIFVRFLMKFEFSRQILEKYWNIKLLLGYCAASSGYSLPSFLETYRLHLQSSINPRNLEIIAFLGIT